jgi:hypothetical protein
MTATTDRHDRHDDDSTTQQAADLLKVSLRTVQRLRRAGKFPNAYKIKGRLFIPLADIDRQRNDRSDRETATNDRPPTTDRHERQTTATPERQERQQTATETATNDRENDTTATPERHERQDTATPATPDNIVSPDMPTEQANDTTPEEPPDVRQALPMAAGPTSVDFRHRLQINWTWFGIRYEYRKPIDEHLIKDALRWAGQKWRAWRNRARSEHQPDTPKS